MDPIRREEAFAMFNARLTVDGVRGALAHLLSFTDYRFIAIFRFQDGKASAAAFYDREDPAQTTTDEVPDSATYCCFVRDRGGVFTTADALADPRLEAHPARQIVRAYCGVPIMDAEGALLGTLCHYDLLPRDPAQVDTELMLQVGSALARRGAVPAYPRRGGLEA